MPNMLLVDAFIQFDESVKIISTVFLTGRVLSYGDLSYLEYGRVLNKL